jgi:hypothetical protein
MIVSSDSNEPPNIKADSNTVTGEYVSLDGEKYFRIENVHQMDDFFMSLVGASDHWMFVSSAGALTAGRRNPDIALFPYGADDQITAARAQSGSLTVVRLTEDQGQVGLWQPFTAATVTPFEILLVSNSDSFAVATSRTLAMFQFPSSCLMASKISYRPARNPSS